ncbi:alpha/beta hydrolase [Paenarthrobacter sp. DKR-5]|uniref:alpha/beta hydrolase n=1 Tax=Paenarthrobacter sp. DKR-5 TaxID=2835535 RepID=UPI002028EDAE|nr:alpha/beta hydrolase [Paenarthrobacter sp. DKR-5]
MAAPVRPPAGGTFTLARRVRRALKRVPVWAWRVLMHAVKKSEHARFNVDPVTGVDYHHDIDFVGDGIHAHRLDVISPPFSPAAGLHPVYVYFHGGGWTSGDKAALTKYCASQAAGGIVVVNVNYRKAPRFHMRHVLEDANAALEWVARNIRRYGGDPQRLVLGGDSAGGQISALLTASGLHAELAEHYALRPAVAQRTIKGLVQHCSIVDFSVFFDRGFVLSLNFVRMLLPGGRRGRHGRAAALREASRFISPIEWLDARFPPVFLTTSERDYFYGANLNFIDRLRRHQVPTRTLIYGWENANTEHTWQQDYRFPESQEVYRQLQDFVHDVAG